MIFKKLLIAILLLLSQIFFLRDYLPFISNTILVQGQRCTCPHARVLNGERSLIPSFPDSLNSEHVDFSEIYFVNEINTSSDPMGVGKYRIKGKIVGISSMSYGDLIAYPRFQIKSYQSATSYLLIQYVIFIIFAVEIFMIVRYIKKRYNHRNY